MNSEWCCGECDVVGVKADRDRLQRELHDERVLSDCIRDERDDARADNAKLRERVRLLVETLRLCGDKFSQATEWEAIPAINAALAAAGDE